MKWYRFWFRVPGSSEIEEEYNVYPEHFKHDEMKDICDRWVDEKMSDYGDGHFEYDFEEIVAPPKKWLLDSIKNNKTKREILKLNNKFYKEIIEEHYRLGDKIDKIKNNINDEVD